MDHLQAGAVAAADVYSEVKELVSKNHHHHHHHHQIMGGGERIGTQ
jgi:hypothetical protein